MNKNKQKYNKELKIFIDSGWLIGDRLPQIIISGDTKLSCVNKSLEVKERSDSKGTIESCSTKRF